MSEAPRRKDAPPRVTVACVKWGTAFPPSYVNVLHRAVRDHLAIPHRFVCVTDLAEGLDPEIDALPFPEFGLERDRWTMKGCWPKVALFSPDLFAPDEIVLYLDLDVMIVGALDDFVHRVRTEPAFYTLREWNPLLWRIFPLRLRPDRGSQGSVYVWRAGEQHHVFERFTRDVAGVLKSFADDRRFIPAVAQGPRYLPYAWCLSFKNVCVRQYPLNALLKPRRPPRNTRVLVFHGKPRPIDLMGTPGRRWGTSRRFGYDPVPWVEEYWRRYGGTLPVH